MKIIEEYYARHNLDKIPLLHFSSTSDWHFNPDVALVHQALIGNFFLKHDTSLGHPPYSIITISWIKAEKGPNYFWIDQKKPNRIDEFNANQSRFYNYDETLRLNSIGGMSAYVDQYSDHFQKVLRGVYHRFDDVINPVHKKDSFFSKWETLIYVYDNYFKNQNSEILYFLNESLDESVDLEIRTYRVKYILQHLYYKQRDIHKFWDYHLGANQPYLQWIYDLIIKINCELNLYKNQIHL